MSRLKTFLDVGPSSRWMTLMPFGQLLKASRRPKMLVTMGAALIRCWDGALLGRRIQSVERGGPETRTMRGLVQFAMCVGYLVCVLSNAYAWRHPASVGAPMYQAFLGITPDVPASPSF